MTKRFRRLYRIEGRRSMTRCSRPSHLRAAWQLSMAANQVWTLDLDMDRLFDR
jgi:hypothetical protein